MRTGNPCPVCGGPELNFGHEYFCETDGCEYLSNCPNSVGWAPGPDDPDAYDYGGDLRRALKAAKQYIVRGLYGRVRKQRVVRFLEFQLETCKNLYFASSKRFLFSDPPDIGARHKADFWALRVQKLNTRLRRVRGL